jgi:thiol-disulfide isomerase/thioredoxin
VDVVGIVMIGVVVVVGVVGGLLHRRLDGRLRDVSDARRRLAELTNGAADTQSARRGSPQAAASAAVAASNAAAAAASPSLAKPASDKPPARGLHVVREGETAVVADVREEPGVVETTPAAETDEDRLDPELLTRLGIGPAPATLLQFSSAFCAPCRAVRRISSEVADLLPGVQHVEVDAESHLTEVRELGIWRTPTLLLLDADGRVAKRATGVPSKPQLIAALADVLPTAD